ncbi:unnamed protein product, partial [Phaeothamnion confervicola]
MTGWKGHGTDQERRAPREWKRFWSTMDKVHFDEDNLGSELRKLLGARLGSARRLIEGPMTLEGAPAAAEPIRGRALIRFVRPGRATKAPLRLAKDSPPITCRATIVEDRVVLDNTNGEPAAPDAVPLGGGCSMEVLCAWGLPSEHDAAGDDSEIRQELRSLHQQLAAAVERVEPQVRALSERVMVEAAVAASPAAAAFRRREAAALQQWKVRMEEQRAEWRAHLSKVDEDMAADCFVCGNGDTPPNDRIVFCERCDIAVHQSCYRVGKIPRGDWFCRPCELLQGTDAEMSTVRTHCISKGPTEFGCALCPNRGGAMVPMAAPAAAAPAAGGPLARWCHAVCALWQGLALARDGTVPLEQKISELKAWPAQRCSFCAQAQGALIACTDDVCGARFHVTCAMAHG